MENPNQAVNIDLLYSEHTADNDNHICRESFPDPYGLDRAFQARPCLIDDTDPHCPRGALGWVVEAQSHP